MYRFTRIILNNYRRLGSFKSQLDFTPQFQKIKRPAQFTVGLSVLEFMGSPRKKAGEEEEEESDLIMTIKRGEHLTLNKFLILFTISKSFRSFKCAERRIQES
jgi:hypothetical protein